MVYLDFYDVAACNTIIECIMMHTPVLTRRLPGTVEYLGEHYPLFFDSIEEASCKLQNKELVIQAHYYLKGVDKERFRIEKFLTDLVKSEIYESAPEWKMI